MIRGFFDDEIQIAIGAAKSGAKRIMHHFAGPSAHQRKASRGEPAGLVTVADMESEQAIIETIRDRFPNDRFLSEEDTTVHVDSVWNASRLWVIDPLDGTNNFAHAIPHFAVSIALWSGGRPVLGVVHAPNTNRWFIAGAGQGAWSNGSRMRVNDHGRLDETMIATGFYYDRGAMMEATLRTIADLFRKDIQGIRRFGAASLDLVGVGMGQFGGYFEYRLSPWDFAASALIVEEAGGRVSDCNGRPLSLHSPNVLATNDRLHASMLEIIQSHWPLRNS
jgi:myo-inositol-1(or 4)-monophosphatase